MSRPHSDAVGSTASKDASRAAPAERDEARVYAAILSVGAEGLTDEEISAFTGLSGNTARPRRVALLDAGKVKWSGATRPTAQGKPANVWVAGSPPAWEAARAERVEVQPCPTCGGATGPLVDKHGGALVGVLVQAAGKVGEGGFRISVGRYDQCREFPAGVDPRAVLAWLDEALDGFLREEDRVAGSWREDVALSGRLPGPILRVLNRLPQKP